MLNKVLNTRWLYLIFFVGVAIVYSNILFNGFVWLDKTYIINNNTAHTFDLFKLIYGNGLVGVHYYRPLISLYFSFLYTAFQQHAFYYHFLQLGFFICNGLLVFKIFNQFIKKTIAIPLSLVFLLSPMNEIDASFISASADTLFMFFGLFALLLYLLDTKNRHIRRTFTFLLISIFFKESGILFFIAVYLYELYIRKNNIKLYTYYFFGSLAFYLGFRLLFHGFNFQPVALDRMENLSILQRSINIPLIIYQYFQGFLFFYKIGIAQEWTVKNILFKNFYFPLIIDTLYFIAIASIGVLIYKTDQKHFRFYIYFLILFLSGLALHLQLLPLDYTISTRYFYFPAFGLLGILGIGLQSLEKKINIKYTFILVIGIFIVTNAVMTIQKNTYWKNDLTLFKHSAAIHDNYIIENWLGQAYMESGNNQIALKHLKKSIKVFPYDENFAEEALAYNNLGNATKTRQFFLQAYQANNYMPLKHSAQLYSVMGKYFLLQHDFPQAEKILLNATHDYPNEDYFWSLLALNKYEMGDTKDAIVAAQKAVQLSPNTFNTSLLYNLISNKSFTVDLQ